VFLNYINSGGNKIKESEKAYKRKSSCFWGPVIQTCSLLFFWENCARGFQGELSGKPSICSGTWNCSWVCRYCFKCITFGVCKMTWRKLLSKGTQISMGTKCEFYKELYFMFMAFGLAFSPSSCKNNAPLNEVGNGSITFTALASVHSSLLRPLLPFLFDHRPNHIPVVFLESVFERGLAFTCYSFWRIF
jgi:hypothetical protein